MARVKIKPLAIAITACMASLECAAFITQRNSVSVVRQFHSAMNAEFHIREATYSDLGQVADLTTDAFFFSTTNANTSAIKNPIMRTIRYLLELDRLQNNFPYKNNDNNENDGRHFYLVATPLKDDVQIIGFCDIDGRMSKAKNEVIGSGLGLSTKKTTMTTVQRPCPYFSDLVVHPSYRRRGVASSLASEAECRAKNNWKYDELFLCIRLNDGMILRMYIDRGYEIVEPSKMSQNMIDFLAVQEGKILLRRSLQG
jgi:ribosomal protein S18 acetylase RimI-like enzyme